jgi:hypothetical protein
MIGLCLWSYAEIALVIIASSAITLPKLLKAKGREIDLIFSFMRLSISRIASLLSSNGEETKVEARLATGNERTRKGYESHEYIMKSIGFDIRSDEAQSRPSRQLDDANGSQLA